MVLDEDNRNRHYREYLGRSLSLLHQPRQRNATNQAIRFIERLERVRFLGEFVTRRSDVKLRGVLGNSQADVRRSPICTIPKMRLQFAVHFPALMRHVPNETAF